MGRSRGSETTFSTAPLDALIVDDGKRFRLFAWLNLILSAAALLAIPMRKETQSSALCSA